MASGTIERKCMKGHKKAEGRCSPRCVRWYPRIQRATPDGHGRRRFDYLGGYPTRAAARAALDQALGRQGDNANGDRANKPSYSSTGVDGRNRRRSTICWTTGSPICKPAKPSGCEPSAATGNYSSTTSAPTSASSR